MKKYYYYLFLLSAVGLSIATYRSWLSGNIFSYSDWPYFHRESLLTNGQLTVWAGWLDFGYFDGLTFWRKPIQILYRIFAAYGMGKETADLYLAFIPVIIINPFISYLIFYKLSKSNIGAFLGTLIFCFNSYFLSINTQGHLYLTISSSLVLLGIYLLISSASNKKTARIVLLSIIGLLITIFDLRNLYLFFGMAFVYYFFDLLYADSVNQKQEWYSVIYSISVLTILTLLLNSYWLLIQLQSDTLLSNSITSRSMIFDRFFSISKAMSLSHPFWTGTGIKWFSINPIPIQLWLIPIVAFGTFMLKKQRLALYFGIITLIGILLSKQSNYPFFRIYQFLFDTIPGFSAFREASKFYILTLIGYSFLVSSFVSLLWNNNEKVTLLQKILKGLLIGLLTVVSLWNTIPYVTGDIEALTKPVHMPREYQSYNDIIKSNKTYSRTLWIPADSRWATYDNLHPKISLINIMYGDWSSFLDKSSKSSEEAIITLLDEKYFNQLLDNASIQYVAIPGEYDANELYTFGRRAAFNAKLNELPFLKKVTMATDEVIVYKNSGIKPHLYTTTKLESINKKIPYTAVNYESPNPSEYNIIIKGISRAFYLNFSEAYHPDWKIRAGTFHWYMILINKDYFMSDQYHVKNDAQLNTYFIEPATACKKFQCTKNVDGSYDMLLTLYYKPQSFMYLGVIISSLTFLSCMAYLIHHLFIKIQNKYVS